MNPNFNCRKVQPYRGRTSYTAVTYNLRERTWENRDRTYSSYREARLHSWRCEKCDSAFATYKLLKSHKIESHSY